MDLDFIPDSSALHIPKEVYLPIKRCSSCSSVYLTDTHCESCGRMIDFSLVGKPFSYKSYFLIKERYLKSFTKLESFYPVLENKKSSAAMSYKRNLTKRFTDIIIAFNNPNEITLTDRKLFYIELKSICLELLDYQTNSNELISIVVENNSGGLLFQELINFINENAKNISPEFSLGELILRHKVFGVLRIEFIFKFSIFMATFIFAAMKFKTLFIH